jgi:hypothetical protein
MRVGIQRFFTEQAPDIYGKIALPQWGGSCSLVRKVLWTCFLDVPESPVDSSKTWCGL